MHLEIFPIMSYLQGYYNLIVTLARNEGFNQKWSGQLLRVILIVIILVINDSIQYNHGVYNSFESNNLYYATNKSQMVTLIIWL